MLCSSNWVVALHGVAKNYAKMCANKSLFLSEFTVKQIISYKDITD